MEIHLVGGLTEHWNCFAQHIVASLQNHTKHDLHTVEAGQTAVLQTIALPTLKSAIYVPQPLKQFGNVQWQYYPQFSLSERLLPKMETKIEGGKPYADFCRGFKQTAELFSAETRSQHFNYGGILEKISAWKETAEWLCQFVLCISVVFCVACVQMCLEVQVFTCPVQHVSVCFSKCRHSCVVLYAQFCLLYVCALCLCQILLATPSSVSI